MGNSQQKAEENKETASRKGSTTTTIKSFNNTVSKLIVLKMVTIEEGEELKKLQKQIFERWVSVEMGIQTESGETTK